MEFKPYPKTPRFNRDVVITEKIDGINACIVVDEHGWVWAQSRKRMITPEADNFGFAAWVQDHWEDLQTLGEGYHYGEWWGKGIQRGYGLEERRFSLFNPDVKIVPACCSVVPVLARTTGNYLNEVIDLSLDILKARGSVAAPGFDRPEGVIIYHTAAGQVFKALIENDDQPKGNS